jgi:uncharacterized protein (DUF1330 family)
VRSNPEYVHAAQRFVEQCAIARSVTGQSHQTETANNAVRELYQLATLRHFLASLTYQTAKEARRRGATFENIGRSLGISKQAAHQLLRTPTLF